MTITVGAALGTGGSVGATQGPGDTDDATFVTLTAGSTGTATGILAILGFHQSWASLAATNPKVQITACAPVAGSSVNAIALGSIGAEWSVDRQNLSLRTGVAPTAGAVYCFSISIAP